MAIAIKNQRTLVTMSKERMHLLKYLAQRNNRTVSNYINAVLDKHLNSLKDKAIMKDYNDFCYELENNI